MSSMAQVDKALDDIIKSNFKTKRRGKFTKGRNVNNKRSRLFKKRRDMSGNWRRGDALEKNPSSGKRILVSNLSFMVTDEDVKELFSEFGAIRKSFVNYDKSGKSHGSAEITFARREDAMAAVQKYNGVSLDGRPMKVEFVSSSVANIRSRVSKPFIGYGRIKSQIRSRRVYGMNRTGKFRKSKVTKNTHTKESLDAELEAYRKAADRLD